MKLYYFLFICVCMIQLKSSAQDCINNVSTHPETKSNNKLPWVVNIMGQDVPDMRFLNNWYWWAQPNRVDMIGGVPTAWPMAIPLNDMGMNPTPDNPFGMTYGNEMNSIQHSSYSGTPYYSHLSWSSMLNIGANQQRFKNEVLLPENGWELISQNRGFFPDLSLLDWYDNSFDMIDSRAVHLI